jgi:class 3 adenylate cyclase/streptogramin lyase
MTGVSAGTKSFLFSDLRGYTAYVERSGDREAAELLATYRDLVRTVIASHQGAEIKTEGDSFYVVFPSAAAAVEAGVAIVARAQQLSSPARPIRVGIGIHAGETVATTEGLVGGAVNIAARVCSKAQPGEVLVTDTVRALTRTFLPYRYTGLGTQQLKGVSGGIPLYRLESGPSARRARLRRQLSARRRRIARLIVGALVVTAVAAAAGVYAANRAPDCVSLPAATSDVVARIDSNRNCVVASFRVGARPGPIAASDAVVWIANLEATSLTGIDPRTGASFTASVLGTPVAVAAGSTGDAYVLLRDDQTLGLESNAVTDRVSWVNARGAARETRALPRLVEGGTAGYEAIAFGDEGAWISDGREGNLIVVRFRSAGLPPPIPVAPGAGLGPIDAGAGATWIGSALEPLVYRLDGLGSRPRGISLPDDHGGILAIDVTDPAVWLGRADGSLTRLDPATGARQTFDVGGRLTSVAAGAGGIWVVDDEAGIVLRADASTGESVPIKVGGRAAGVATGRDGSVWVTVQSR